MVGTKVLEKVHAVDVPAEAASRYLCRVKHGEEHDKRAHNHAKRNERHNTLAGAVERAKRDVWQEGNRGRNAKQKPGPDGEGRRGGKWGRGRERQTETERETERQRDRETETER